MFAVVRSGISASVERDAKVVIPATIDKLWSRAEPRIALAEILADSVTLESVDLPSIAALRIVETSTIAESIEVDMCVTVASVVIVPMVATIAAAEEPFTTDMMVVSISGFVTSAEIFLVADAWIVDAVATVEVTRLET